MLQHIDMKPLKEKCDIDDKDELQQITAARTPMKKVYLKCIKSFMCDMKSKICNAKLVEKLIQKECTELRKNYCGKIFRNINKVDNIIFKVCELTCHECSTKDEVENYKEHRVVEKADLIIKKDREHKEITREKVNMKDSFEKAMTVNNEPRLNID